MYGTDPGCGGVHSGGRDGMLALHPGGLLVSCIVSMGTNGGTLAASLISIPDGELVVAGWLDAVGRLGGNRDGFGGLERGGGGGGSSGCERDVGNSACCGEGCCAVECCAVESCAVGCNCASVRVLVAGVASCDAFVGGFARTVPCCCMGDGERKLDWGTCCCLDCASSLCSLAPDGTSARSPCGCLSDIVVVVIE